MSSSGSPSGSSFSFSTSSSSHSSSSSFSSSSSSTSGSFSVPPLAMPCTLNDVCKVARFQWQVIIARKKENIKGNINNLDKGHKPKNNSFDIAKSISLSGHKETLRQLPQ
nr:protein AF-9-like [Penaeus vannamei]